MGLVSILLGLALVGVLADFLAENDVLNANERDFMLFDHTLHISVWFLIVGAFAVGVIAMLLILSGIRRMRHKSHSQLKARVTSLENENARLITRENLPNVIPVPETERLAPQKRPSQPPPGAPVEQPAVVVPQQARAAPSPEAPKPAPEVEPAPIAAPIEQVQPVPTAAKAVPAAAVAKTSRPVAAKAQQAPPAAEVVEVPEPVAAPVEPPRLEPVGLPPEQAAQKRAALARTAAAKKIGTPEPEHDDIKPISGYEDPPPSTPPEAFLDLQREIAAKTDAEEAPASKPARTRAAKTKPAPAPAPPPPPAKAKPAPKEDVVVVPEAEDEEEPSLASSAPSDTSVPTTWEWP